MADPDYHVPTREVLDVDEDGNPITVWKIALRDELRATMATDPQPHWAATEAERDWYLEKGLHRPREDYVAEEVPGPISRAIADEKERWARRRRELWEERHPS